MESGASGDHSCQAASRAGACSCDQTRWMLVATGGAGSARRASEAKTAAQVQRMAAEAELEAARIKAQAAEVLAHSEASAIKIQADARAYAAEKEAASERSRLEALGSSLTRAQSDALVERCTAELEAEGWGIWATEVVGGPAFIGMVGLHRVNPTLPCAPANALE